MSCRDCVGIDILRIAAEREVERMRGLVEDALDAYAASSEEIARIRREAGLD